MKRFLIRDALFIFLCSMTMEASSHLTVPESIRLHGYPCEEHFVTTEDGYILAMHRIPWGKDGKGKGKVRKPLIMQHGLFSSSATYTLNLPQIAPAYIFVEEGYDVWLTNVRGGDYSKNHTHLSVKSKEFWNFSWDEMAKYDLTKFIDYVTKHTKHKKVDYIGHSMGTTIFFALMSSIPKYNSKINHAVCMAPVANVAHIATLAKYLAHAESEIRFALNAFGDYEIIPERDSNAVKFFNLLCNRVPLLGKTCKNLLFMIVGFDDSEFDESWMPTINDELLTGTSLNTVIHFSQEYLAGRFQHFDYGSTENTKRYGQTTPLEYDVSKIKAPVHLLWGMNDYLADDADVQFLIKNLPNLRSKYAVPLKQFNHLDFLWAKDKMELVYKPIIKMLKGHSVNSTPLRNGTSPTEL